MTASASTNQPIDLDAVHLLATVLADVIRAPEPIMVNKGGAARFYSVSVATYTKYEKKGLFPPMNAAGLVSVETLKRAAMALDGIAEPDFIGDPGECALRDWEKQR